MAITDDTLYRLKGSQVKDIANRILGEINERVSGDNLLQGEIDSMQLASDVTDIVGTYTDLQNYDTTGLTDKDIILVLSDSTHSNAEAYYRWSESSSAFSYIGSVGPYYTKSETNNLLLDKQDVLTAGTNITITTAGGVTTISATGITSAQTIFYANLGETGSTRYIYKDIDFTTKASAQDIINANDDGQVILRITSTVNPTAYNDAYLQNAFIMPHNSDFEFVFLDRDVWHEYSVSNVTDDAFYYTNSSIQPRLTAGSNITITGTTISATDTTYSAFTGASSLNAGTSGLVPAPAAGDDTKFLAGDGLWKTVSAYALPIASANDLGGIKVGSNLTIDSQTGVLDAIDTTYSAFTGASAGADGASGLVTKPVAGDNTKYLKGDGSWDTPTDTTYSTFTGATAGDAGTSGLVPAPAAGDQGKVLTGGATYLGVDTTVTQSSSNLVTSGAVYTVVGDVESLLNAI